MTVEGNELPVRADVAPATLSEACRNHKINDRA
jgi:hypothetical protein